MPISTVPEPIESGFPAEVRKDLQYLCSTIDLLSYQQADPPVSMESVREVLITGVTGFFTSFLLADLLHERRDLVAHCIVRAENDIEASNRVRAKLCNYDLWDDSFSGRINAIAGDITEANFGIDSSRFRELTARVHAVYHCATSTNLGETYERIRKTNVYGFLPILDLCMQNRLKHLFFTSSLGIFPEYLSLFREEFSTRYIEHQSQPDLAELERVSPPALAGYSWSKIVGEQLVLRVHSYGVPVGIFRLPIMAYTEVGITNPEAISVRILAAYEDLQVRVHSELPVPFPMDPADRMAKIVAAISLNTERCYTTYQCCNPAPMIPSFLHGVARQYTEVSYEEFRKKSVACGEKSPLFGEFSALDLYRKYWFDAKSQAEGIPVDNQAMLEDFPDKIEWIGGLTLLALRNKWQKNNPHLWPYRPQEVRLDLDGLISYGEFIADQLEVPFEQSNPPWMIDALSEWINGYNRILRLQNQNEESSRWTYASGRGFSIRAELYLERKNYPEIAKERIERPIFIIGLNRTGTTFLHRILATDPRFWTIKLYQIYQPSLPDGKFGDTDRLHEELRFARATDLFRARQVHGGGSMEFQHETGLELPEEEGFLLALCYKAWEFGVMAYNPDYSRYLESADFDNAYEFHHALLQNFSYRWRQGGASGQWLLKYPFHLNQLEELIKIYPDARFIMTHRPLPKVVGSFCSLINTIRTPSEIIQSSSEFGREQLRFLSNMANRAVKFRESHPELEDRWMDISFFEFIENPLGVVEAIYNHIGWTLSKKNETDIRAYMAVTEEKTSLRKKHQYNLEDYDLTQQDIEQAFAPYLNFIDRLRVFDAGAVSC